MEWRERISTKPNICHGATCIAGTRIMVSVILDNIAEGASADQIVRAYPSLALEDVRAAIAYAAEVLRDEIVYLPEARA
jgi:uncharacterized protein (DUF433 family)